MGAASATKSASIDADFKEAPESGHTTKLETKILKTTATAACLMRDRVWVSEVISRREIILWGRSVLCEGCRERFCLIAQGSSVGALANRRVNKSIGSFVPDHCGGGKFVNGILCTAGLMGCPETSNDHLGVAPRFVWLAFVRCCSVLGVCVGNMCTPSNAWAPTSRQDDRALRHSEKLQTLLLDCFRDVVETPLFVYERLGSLIGQTGRHLRHAAIAAASTSFAYIDRDVLETIRSPPLSLCQGDIADNVRRLAEMNGVTEPVGKHLKQLMAEGVPQTHIEDALRLLLNTPCTMTSVEQGHASGAQLLRAHPTYGEDALIGGLGRAA